MEQPTLSLSHFMNELQMVIRSSFDKTYWVVAELASISDSTRGHLYMELVEKAEQQIIAKARANLWSSRRQQIITAFEHVTHETLKAGMKVLMQLSVDFHPVFGLSFQIVDIDPNYSLGEMERQKQETIQRLNNEGLLDFNKQYVLPAVIQNIAIISSESAAGYQDFMNQLTHNNFGYTFKTFLFQALMQGEQAPASIMKALNQLELKKTEFDIIVIIRGGGSNLDLACFDNYELNARLAQTIFPIFTGIGHERDQSVTDMIAHTRLKTPTAVAEYIISYNAEFENLMVQEFQKITAKCMNLVEKEKLTIRNLAKSLTWEPTKIVQMQHIAQKELSYDFSRWSTKLLHENQMTIRQKRADLFHLAQRLVKTNKTELNQIPGKLKTNSLQLIQTQRNQILSPGKSIAKTSYIIDKEAVKIQLLNQVIQMANPENLLKRGFSITRQNGKVITQTHQLQEHIELETQLMDGIIVSIIKKDTP